MTALKIILILVEIISSALLICVILLQKAKGEGLGMAFGAEMGESIFGARASNVLVKVTIWLGAIFLLNTAILAMIYSQAHPGSLLNRPTGQTRAPIEQPAAPQSLPAPLPSAPSAPISESPAPQGVNLPAPAAP